MSELLATRLTYSAIIFSYLAACCTLVLMRMLTEGLYRSINGCKKIKRAGTMGVTLGLIGLTSLIPLLYVEIPGGNVFGEAISNNPTKALIFVALINFAIPFTILWMAIEYLEIHINLKLCFKGLVNPTDPHKTISTFAEKVGAFPLVPSPVWDAIQEFLHSQTQIEAGGSSKDRKMWWLRKLEFDYATPESRARLIKGWAEVQDEDVA